MLIDILTCTGIRVSECSNLKIMHLHISYGKGNVSGTIQIPGGLEKHIKSFLKWKAEPNETVQPDDFLFIGQHGKMSGKAIQQIVKKYLKTLNL